MEEIELPDWLVVTWLIVSIIWTTGAIGIFVWAMVTSWLWGRNHPEPTEPSDYEIVHNGSNPVTGCVVCFMWPLIIVAGVYQWFRNKKA